MFTVPVLTPRLSSYWMALLIPVPTGVIMPLVEGLKNEVVCRNNAIRDLIPIHLISMEEAICTALSEMAQGLELLASCQSCLRS